VPESNGEGVETIAKAKAGAPCRRDMPLADAGGEMTERMPTEMLEEEHRSILKVMGALPVLIEGLETGQKVEADTLQRVVQFMRTFADTCHHGKEEAHLFPALEKKGVPMQGCPVGALTREHQQGRALVVGLAEAVEAYARGDAAAKDALLANLRGITAHYPNHIWKEDYLLFPMTNKVLSPDDQKDLREKFEAVEDAIGRDVHDRLEQMAEGLLASLVSRSSEGNPH
jgi:hemerythrin-like domain-containing protein